MFAIYRCLLLVVVAICPSLAMAQGLLVDVRPDQHYRLPRPRIYPPPRPPRRPPPPQPPQSYKIQKLGVQVNLEDQVAKVQVSQSFVNTGSRSMEVCFVFPLPYDGAVDRMTFMLDGKEFAAELLDAREARRVYEAYVRRNQDPALLEWLGTGMFKTSVFPVPPGAKRTVTLHYSQICRQSDGLTEWLFPLSTAKYTSHPVEQVAVDLSIRSQVPIKNVYSPTHDVQTTRPSPHHARVVYTSKQKVPTSDFRLLYDVGDQPVAASVLSYRPDASEEGYFLLLVSPEITRTNQEPMRKAVQFVVDRSGSMSGKKIDQAKAALKFVLNNLHENDLFNIITYDSSIESFQPELQRFNDQLRTDALAFVEGIYAGGSTNIDGALQVALDQLRDRHLPTYVVFLTDGLPTAGERHESKIIANARSRNQVRARLFPFGVGYDVNSRLLDKLARTGFGQSHYVRPDEDIEAHVSRLYRRIGAPTMVDMKITFDMEDRPLEEGQPVSRLYPQDPLDLFAGDQLVIVGRYKQPGQAKVTIQGSVDGQEQLFDFPVEFLDKSSDDSHAFIEKLWAVRRVGEIIDEIDLHGKNDELVKELVALATKHGILTPYTSFLADDTSDLRDLSMLRRRTNVRLEDLKLESGANAFGQRVAKSHLQNAARAPASGYQGNLASDAAGGSQGMAGSASPLGGGMGGGMGGRPTAGRRAGMASATASATTPPQQTARTVLNVGRKTFFWRNQRWEDSTLTAQQEQNVRKLERYGDEYFKLINQFGQETAKYLAIDEHVVVVLDGQAFEF